MSANKFLGAAAGVLTALLLLLSALGAVKAEGGAGPEARNMDDIRIAVFGYLTLTFGRAGDVVLDAAIDEAPDPDCVQDADIEAQAERPKRAIVTTTIQCPRRPGGSGADLLS